MTTDDNFGNEITLKVNDSAATAESEEKTSPQTLNRSRKGARRIVLFTRTGGPTEATDEWMMTYMDTVTLLITLFVLLLSFSTIKEEKYQAVAQGLSLGKYGSGILMGGIGLKPASVTQSTILTLPGETPPAEASLNGRDRAQEVADKMTEIFEGADLKGLVGVTVREDTVDLELNERVLFTTGIAELTDLGLSIIDRVAPPLRGEKFHISVEGHTDNIPLLPMSVGIKNLPFIKVIE